jgi:mRNA interferase RelE/StbE
VSTPYHILISPHAATSFASLDKKRKKVILQVVEALAINPRPPGSNKVEGMVGLYRNNIKDFKILYKIEEQAVLLLSIEHTA